MFSHSGQKGQERIVGDSPLILGKVVFFRKFGNIQNANIGIGSHANFDKFNIVSMTNAFERAGQEEGKRGRMSALNENVNGFRNRVVIGCKNIVGSLVVAKINLGCGL